MEFGTGMRSIPEKHPEGAFMEPPHPPIELSANLIKYADNCKKIYLTPRHYQYTLKLLILRCRKAFVL